MAFTIEQVQRPTLVIAHNKTLAAQLCNEFRELFPENAVEYFVSYYDYYQPEAYVPAQDLYIEKDSSINEEIERLRHSATSALFGRRDVIVVASVSCIFGLGSPEAYDRLMLLLKQGEMIDRDKTLRKLVDIQYTRNDTALGRGTFRVRGEALEVYPAYAETADPRRPVRRRGGDTSRSSTRSPARCSRSSSTWPSGRPPTTRPTRTRSSARWGRSATSWRPAARCWRRRASRWSPTACASAPSSTWRCSASWASATGSRTTRASSTAARPARGPTAWWTSSRTTSSASSTSPTRPCRRSAACTRATAAASRRSWSTASGCPARSTTAPRPSTSSFRSCRRWCSSRPRPGDWERTHSTKVVEQIVRPTGIIDPPVDVRETKNQIDDLMNEIRATTEAGERTLVTTLTKKMSEDLTDYLMEYGVRVRYLHSEVDTLERIQIIRELRLGEFDVLVGVNLLQGGARPPRGVAGGHPRRRQGGLPARGDLADPDHRPRCPQRARQGDHVRRQGDRGHAPRHLGDRAPQQDPARLQRGARDHPGDDPEGRVRHRRLPRAGVQGPGQPPQARAGPRRA